MEGRWNYTCGQKNLYAEQLKDQEENPSRKSWPSEYRTSWTVTNDGFDQRKLLVVRDKEWCQKICSRILQISAKQGATYEKTWRTTSLENTRRSMVRDQLMLLDHYQNPIRRTLLWL